MKAAAKRQMDFEKIQEKKMQKEREQEGDLWSDKEVEFFKFLIYKKYKIHFFSLNKGFRYNSL